MRLAIMQPYFFPYIGYFQLVAAVDRFVFYDDVNYIKNGWINRNRVLAGAGDRYITVPLSGASPSAKIRDVPMQPREVWLRKMLESLRHTYAKAPHYARVSALVERSLSASTDHISTLASQTVVDVCQYLDIDTEFVATSTQYGNAELKSTDRVLDICAKERARVYVNLPGGRALYDEATFHSNDIELAFIQPNLSAYAQFEHAFRPGLSILDVLMFNTPDRVRAMLSTEPSR
ncbi:WbqC family protein [Caballeronia sp. GaOx3]|uniref:WbqC family protein n=1 Tax=Caballeronia sp. GaOx3 TaxID=2921740 RepID=UPI0020291E2D|nr:WbqC family protein [Caballeronia sp. GaOx3]